MKKLAILLVMIVATSGCSKNLSPFSPESRKNLKNQNGKIDEIKNNQQGMMTEIGKLRLDMQANQSQQGNLNKANENAGIQILQGDGGLIAFFGLGVIGLLLVFYYKTRADKSEKAANILAQQIALKNDPDLENQVFTAALNSGAEEEIYKAITKQQRILKINH